MLRLNACDRTNPLVDSIAGTAHISNDHVAKTRSGMMIKKNNRTAMLIDADAEHEQSGNCSQWLAIALHRK